MSARHLAFATANLTVDQQTAILESIAEAGYELRRKSVKHAVGGVPAWQAWETAHKAAKRACLAELGERWYLVPGASQYVTIPRNWANYRFTRKDGTLSVPIKGRRDHRVPAPRYWPGGSLPAGIELEEDCPAYFRA